jgi:hypothetical protein
MFIQNWTSYDCGRLFNYHKGPLMSTVLKKYHGPSIEHQLCSPFDWKISSSPAVPQTGDILDVLQYIAISSIVHCRDSP